MSEQYTAAIYCSEEQVAIKDGDNVDKLYTWMLTQVSGNFGDIHGEIIDNKTKKTIRTFRKCAIE